MPPFPDDLHLRKALTELCAHTNSPALARLSRESSSSLPRNIRDSIADMLASDLVRTYRQACDDLSRISTALSLMSILAWAAGSSGSCQAKERARGCAIHVSHRQTLSIIDSCGVNDVKSIENRHDLLAAAAHEQRTRQTLCQDLTCC